MAERWEHHDEAHPGCGCSACVDRTHSERQPHWSVGMPWPANRWDPMNSAPSRGSKILDIRGRAADGRVLEPMHYAHGGGEEQPRFRGWFIPCGSRFQQVEPVEWQPLEVAPC